MIERQFIVANKMGLHARPAAMFVQAASRYVCEVRVVKDDTQVNGKSVMGLMMLAAEHGSTLTVRAWGLDEVKAMETIDKIFQQKFSEE